MSTEVRPELRRKLALAGGLLALAVPALSACGMNYPTDRPNEIINGGTNIEGDGMRVNAARIVSPAEGEGIFIATITLNPTVNAATTGTPHPSFVGLSSDSEPSATPTQEFSVELDDQGLVNLADPEVGGIAVTGDFVPGDIVEVTLEFDDEEEPVTVSAPVVTKCGDYESVVAQGSPESVPVEDSGAPDEESSIYSCEYPPAELPEH